MTEIEINFVKNVYDKIADDFDDTRYCVWNFVKLFLRDKQSLKGIDIGCGNGKNMIYTNMIGLDYCSKLVDICKSKGKNIIQGCCCNLPFKNNTFDYSICISVVHHLSTHERRLQAIREMIRVVKPGGKILFNMWSVENQDKRHFIQGDNYVAWNMKPVKNRITESHLRYYYIHDIYSIYSFCENIVANIKVTINIIYNEKGNWVIHLTKKS
jgi:ubiquinone/menaquinone biosynthesis C-methylase UbiE